MTEFQNYEVEFRIIKTDGKYSSPDGAINDIIIKLMNELGIRDPSEFMVTRFREKYFQSIRRVE